MSFCCHSTAFIINFSILKPYQKRPLRVTYFRRAKEGAQQTGAQTGGADLLLLCLCVVSVFKQLDLMQGESRKTLIV